MQQQKRIGWAVPWATATFWSLAGLGVVVACLSWAWFGFVEFEVLTEECKAQAAGTSEEGFGFLIGTIPLILAHLLGLALLIWFGTVAYRPRGFGPVWALFMVAISSLAGLTVAQLLWNGELFEMGTRAAMCG